MEPRIPPPFRNDIIMLNNIMKTLECPVCLEVFQAPVYICINGHSVCKSCLTKTGTKLCPTCRTEMSTTRNYFVENTVEKCKSIQNTAFSLLTGDGSNNITIGDIKTIQYMFVKTIEDMFEMVNKECETLRKKLKTQSNSFECVNKEFGALAQKLKAVEKQNKELEAQYSEYQKEKVESVVTIMDLRKQLKNKNAKIEDLEKLTSSLRLEIDEIKSSTNTLVENDKREKELLRKQNDEMRKELVESCVRFNRILSVNDIENIQTITEDVKENDIETPKETGFVEEKSKKKRNKQKKSYIYH